MTAPVLTVSHLSYAYPAQSSWRGRPRGAVPVLEDVNLQVSAGETVAIIGPSGCGKSTLLAVLTGLLSADSGTITVNGRCVDSVIGQVALMPQNDALFEWLSVVDNVGLSARIAGESPRSYRGRARALLTEFGLDQVADAWPAELSGGMRSRVAFLRTIMAGSPIVALDEPFGALDALTREDVQQWLMRVAQEQELTLVMVTHDVDEAITVADRVAVMGSAPGGIRTVIDTAGVDRRHPDFGALAVSARQALVAASAR